MAKLLRKKSTRRRRIPKPAYRPDDLNLLHLGDPVGLYRNLAQLYYRAIDPVTELVQNSVAAILERQGSDPSATGRVEVTIDVSKEEPSLVVEDNGIGFSDLRMVGANLTTRDILTSTPYSGFGIGLSAVVARSDFFGIDSINTRNEQHVAYWEQVADGLEKGDQESGHMKPTQVGGPDLVDRKPNTRVEVGGKLFAALWAEAKENPKKLLDMILFHTALGHTSYIWHDSSRPNINYHVNIVGGKEDINKVGQVGFPFVRLGEKDTIAYDDAVLQRPTSDRLIIYTRVAKATKTRPYSLRLYLACEVKRTILKEKFPAYLESLATHKIFASISGFPQSFTVEPPPEKQTRSLWGNILALVDADTNVVEPGRNKISDDYLHEIRKELRDAVNKLDKLAKQIREDEEGRKEIVSAAEACRDAEAATRKNPLRNLPGLEFALKKVPQAEVEVIALFVELVSHKYIKHTEILALGGPFTVYDQYLRYRFRWREIGGKARPKRSEGKKKLDLEKLNEQTLISEFKQEAAALARELEKPSCNKRLEQIDLLISWSKGSPPKGYRLYPLKPEERFFVAATHRLLEGEKIDDQHSCECVILESFLQELEENLPG